MPFRYQQPIPALIVADYTTKFVDPLKVRAGETVTLGEKDTEWPGWIWGTTSSGKSGWVPESYLEVDGERGVMKFDYDASELTVKVGDTVTVLKEESGWYWCANMKGETGWVPRENVGTM